MNQQLTQVKEFTKEFKQLMPLIPTLPSSDIIQLRLKLMLEELTELAVASGQVGKYHSLLEEELFNVETIEPTEPNMIECMDALCDIGYIHVGTVVAYGLEDYYDHNFNLVHKSNMSKLCKNMDEVDATIKFYKNKGIDVTYEKNGKYYIIKRISDGKILKNINYNAVQIEL